MKQSYVACKVDNCLFLKNNVFVDSPVFYFSRLRGKMK